MILKLFFSKFSHLNTVIKDEQEKYYVIPYITAQNLEVHFIYVHFSRETICSFANCFYLVLFYPLCANSGIYHHTSLLGANKTQLINRKGPMPTSKVHVSPMQQTLDI